jgi:hypothetical protein
LVQSTENPNSINIKSSKIPLKYPSTEATNDPKEETHNFPNHRGPNRFIRKSKKEQTEIKDTEKRISPWISAFRTLGARVFTSSLSHGHGSNLSRIRVCGYMYRRREVKWETEGIVFAAWGENGREENKWGESGPAERGECVCEVRVKRMERNRKEKEKGEGVLRWGERGRKKEKKKKEKREKGKGFVFGEEIKERDNAIFNRLIPSWHVVRKRFSFILKLQLLLITSKPLFLIILSFTHLHLTPHIYFNYIQSIQLIIYSIRTHYHYYYSSVILTETYFIFLA